MFVSGFLDSPFLLWVFLFLFFFPFPPGLWCFFFSLPSYFRLLPPQHGVRTPRFPHRCRILKTRFFSLSFFSFLCESFRQLFGSGATLRFLSPRPCPRRSSPGYVVGYESDRVSRTSSSEPRFVVPPARFSTCGCVGYSIRLCNVASPVPLAYILL